METVDNTMWDSLRISEGCPYSEVYVAGWQDQKLDWNIQLSLSLTFFNLNSTFSFLDVISKILKIIDLNKCAHIFSKYKRMFLCQNIFIDYRKWKKMHTITFLIT